MVARLTIILADELLRQIKDRQGAFVCGKGGHITGGK
jgi:hypothetical protein